MPLPFLTINRNWFKGTDIQELNWDAIKDPLESWAANLKLGLTQLTRDLFGPTYPINTDGVGTLPQSNFGYIEKLKNNEIQTPPWRLGRTKNLGFRKFQTVDPDDSIALVGSNGEDLSQANKLQVLMKHRTQPGVLVFTSIEVPLSVKLTGAHFGLSGGGNLADAILEVCLIDDGGAVPALAVQSMTGRLLISNTLCFTAQASVNTPARVLVNRAIAAGNHAIYPLGYIRCDYTDTAVPAIYGPAATTAVVDDSSFGLRAWSNPGNAVASDNVYTSPGNNSSPQQSHFLKARIGGASDTLRTILGATAIIRGVIVEVDRKENTAAANIVDSWVSFIDSLGNIISDSKADTVTEWPTAEATKTYGTSSDLWGADWSSLMDEVVFFAFAVQTIGGTGGQLIEAQVDQIRFTIHYDQGQNTSWKIKTLFPGERTDGVVRPWSQITSHFVAAQKPSVGKFAWSVYGALVAIDYQFGTNGTSNNTGYDLTLPVQGASGSQRPIGPAVDNSVVLADAARGLVNGLTLTLSRTLTATTWTAALGKNCRCQMFYFGLET